jgi:hypothetical protein
LSVHLGFFEPPASFRCGGNLKEPAQYSKTVAAAEPERTGMRRESIGERTRVVAYLPECFRDELRYCLRVLLILDEVSSGPRGPAYWQTAND